jgi:hypothetical protein
MTTRSVLLGDVRRLQHLLESPRSSDFEINNALHVLEYDVRQWRRSSEVDPPQEPSWHKRDAGGLASFVAISLFCACIVAAGALLS